jgi:CRISPR/Cas system CSM-associated protein Csm3 (group 7 of RAMP superfamily)
MRYKIEFLDYWHIGSGVTGGSRVDNLVLKDRNNIPYISGKTLKGLFREMAEIIDIEKAKKCFGEEETKQGILYFSDACLDENTKKLIKEKNLQENLYTKLTSTKIGKNGIAEGDTLREIEVTIPMTLYAQIDFVEKEDREFIKKSIQMVKRMGLNRNRGLGRCKITLLEGEK